MFPELEPVKKEWRCERGNQNDENGISPVVQCDREPRAADEDSEKSERWQDICAAQAKPANEARADERKEVSGDRVCVILVNLEERFDVGKACTTDDRERNVEWMIGLAIAFFAAISLIPGSPTKKASGRSPNASATRIAANATTSSAEDFKFSVGLVCVPSL